MRKAQITTFVLIGLAVLLVVVLLLFFSRTVNKEETLPETFRPVQDMVASCIDSSLERLLRKAGANGGLLETGHLRQSPLVWESDTVPLLPQQVPYWSHLRDCPQSPLGCEDSAQPPLCSPGSSCPFQSFGQGSIEAQLEAALPQALKECLADFAAVQDLFLIEAHGTTNADVTISEGAVYGFVSMPITITHAASGAVVSASHFNGEVDVDLDRVYSLANTLTNAERETAFLEDRTLHLLALYSGVDQEIPPLREVTLLGQRRFWSRSRVERSLQFDVLPWLSFMQMPNALGGYTPLWPEEDIAAQLSEEERFMYAGILYYLTVKPDNETYEDFAVRFHYPYARPYLSINGGQELLKARSIETNNFLQRLTGIFLNDYRFSYDLAFPVIVTIRDTDAFDGDGYEFSFALEANIRRNEPVNRSGTAQSFLLVDEHVDPLAPAQRVANSIAIAVQDRRSGDPLDDARITYRCGQDFFIGATDADGVLRTRLPYCRTGGVLLASAPNYLGDGIEYDNYEEGTNVQLELKLWPLAPLDVILTKRTSSQVAQLNLTPMTRLDRLTHASRLDDVEVGLVSLRRVPEGAYEDEHPLLGFYLYGNGNQSFAHDIGTGQIDQVPPPELSAADALEEAASSSSLTDLPARPSYTLNLAPGTYEVEGYLIYNAPVAIPEEDRCVSILGSCAIGLGPTVHLNATNFTTWMEGATIIRFEISPEELYDADVLALFALAERIPATWSELEEYQGPDLYLQGKDIFQEPVLE